MPRWLWVATGTASKMRSICSAREAVGEQALARAAGEHLLGARAGRHPLRLDAGEHPRAALGGDRGAEEGVDLLRRDARRRGRDGLGIAGGDRHLGAHPVLALAHLLGDPGGELLGAQGLGRDHGVDRLVDDLLEARHVHAGLAWLEVDHALQLGEIEAPGDVDHLLDAVDADPGQADLRRRARRPGRRGSRRVSLGRRHQGYVADRHCRRGVRSWPGSTCNTPRRPSN